MTQRANPVTLTLYSSPKGDTTTLGPKGLCPLSEAMQPFYTTRGASRAPFLLICGEAATTTLGLKGRQS